MSAGRPILATSRPPSFIVAVILVFLFACLDVATGYEIRLSLFYLIPVALVTWWTGFLAGLSVSVLSVIAMVVVDNFVMRDLPFPSHNLIPYWNTGIRLSYFVVIATILAALKRAYEREIRHAREDSLTGVANIRAFEAVARNEIERAIRYRHPLTFAYVDCDNFKELNDQFGHGAGDQVLRLVAMTLLERSRSSDFVARVGGDEFVILLPETDAAAAGEVMHGLRTVLAHKMKANAWTVTVSVGVCTFLTPPATLELALRLSDDLLYAAKRCGKNTVNHRIFDGPAAVTQIDA